MVTDEMVEKAARAMCEAADDNWNWSVFYIVDANDTAETAQNLYRGMARAALEAALSAAEPRGYLVHDKDNPDGRYFKQKPSISDDDMSEYEIWIEPLCTAPTAPYVAVKALRWKGPDSHGEYHSLDGLWGYIIRSGNGNGFWLTEIGDYFTSPEAAKAAAQADYEARILSALSAQVQDVAEQEPKEIATWEDQQAFEAWAKSQRYEMHQHPLHYLFLDPKTDAARQGWKAALQFIRDRSAAAPAKQEGGHD